MSELFNIEAIVNYPKLETKDGEREKFSAMFLLKKEAVAQIDEFLKPYKMINKKAISKVKEIDRSKFKDLPIEYTHSLNMGGVAEWITVLDIRENEILLTDISRGDHVFLSCKPSETKYQNKSYLGAFVNTIALITPQAVEIKTKQTIDDSYLQKIRAFSKASDNASITL